MEESQEGSLVWVFKLDKKELKVWKKIVEFRTFITLYF